MTEVMDVIAVGADDGTVETLEAESEVIETLELRYRDDCWFVEALVSCEFDEHFTEMVGIDWDDLDEWADKRARRIETWFAARYGCIVEDGWTTLKGRFTVMVRPSEPVENLEELVLKRTRAARLFNESDPGTYGCDDLWRRLADFLSRS
jgi:hypothetical protein